MTAPSLIATSAWTLVTPEVQAEVDSQDTQVARVRLRELAHSLVAATECNYETARRAIHRALARRRDERLRPAEPNRLMTLAEASERFAVGHATLRRAALDQRLPAEKRGRDWWVWLDDAREFARTVTPRPRQ